MGVFSRLNELQGDLLLLPGLMTHISGDVNFPAQCVYLLMLHPPKNDGKLAIFLRLVGSVTDRRDRALRQPQDGMR